MTAGETGPSEAHQVDCPDSVSLHAMTLAAAEPLPRHVAECPCCRGLWNEAIALTNVLQIEATDLFPDNCPNENQWAVAADGGLTGELVAHLDRCSRCRALWAYVVRVGRRTGGHRRYGWRLRQWAAVASLLLGLLLWARPWAPVPSASEGIIRGATVRLEGAVERMDGGHVVLSWTSGPPGVDYRLRIWSQKGHLLWDERLAATRRRLDLAALARRSSTFLWQVEALEAGREVGGTSVRSLALATSAGERRGPS